jgi:hypothetical protein
MWELLELATIGGSLCRTHFEPNRGEPRGFRTESRCQVVRVSTDGRSSATAR